MITVKFQKRKDDFFFGLKRVRNRSTRRMIRLIKGDAKCRHLKRLPVKGLRGRCLSVWGPEPHTLPLQTVYVYTVYILTQGTCDKILWLDTKRSVSYSKVLV